MTYREGKNNLINTTIAAANIHMEAYNKGTGKAKDAEIALKLAQVQLLSIIASELVTFNSREGA